MILFTDITVKTKSETETQGVYEIAPLPRGYGHTLINPLRRVLLSSLEGAGITSIKIKDAKHEYTTIDGVTEDIVEIILNLKSIRFKSSNSEPQVCKLSVSGKKIAKAKDIDVTGSVEIMTPDVEIAHLNTEGAKLEMEIVIEKGVGYKVADEENRSDLGRIPLDTDFSPIKNVKIELGKARKGQETDLDSVLIDITTDGSIAPKDALLQSVKTLQEFAGRVMLALGISKLEVEQLAEASSTPIIEEVEENMQMADGKSLNDRIEDLQISKRSKTGLLNGGYEVVSDLSKITKKELAKLPGFGAKSLNEVIAILSDYGITLED